jgi:hypothetical protein
LNEPENSPESEVELSYDDLKVQIMDLLHKAKRDPNIKNHFVIFLNQMKGIITNIADSDDQQIQSFGTPGPHSMRHSKNSPISFAFNK